MRQQILTQEIVRRLSNTCEKMNNKVVERTGRRLTSLFPLTNLLGGVGRGREDECSICYQGAEDVPDCTKQSLLYENVPDAYQSQEQTSL